VSERGNHVGEIRDTVPVEAVWPSRSPGYRTLRGIGTERSAKGRDPAEKLLDDGVRKLVADHPALAFGADNLVGAQEP
jgi:hypothetical protein